MSKDTGRFQNDNPPLQNLPVNTVEGRRIRKVFSNPLSMEELRKIYDKDFPRTNETRVYTGLKVHTMDPQEALFRLMTALHEKDREESAHLLNVLGSWIDRGGFMPDVQAMSDARGYLGFSVTKPVQCKPRH